MLYSSPSLSHPSSFLSLTLYTLHPFTHTPSPLTLLFTEPLSPFLLPLPHSVYSSPIHTHSLSPHSTLHTQSSSFLSPHSTLRPVFLLPLPSLFTQSLTLPPSSPLTLYTLHPVFLLPLPSLCILFTQSSSFLFPHSTLH